MKIIEITDIKKKISYNIANVYILIISILIFIVFLRIAREFFNVENYTHNLYMLVIFTFIVGLGFIMKKTPLVVLTGFYLLVYAAWLYYELFNGFILENEAIGHYIWFIAIPIGALISSTIKKNLDEINERLEMERITIAKYSTRDIITGFRNKRELLTNVDIAINAYEKKKIKFSVILISLQELELLEEELGQDGMEKLYSYISNILKESTEIENEKFFLGKGEFAITLWNIGENEIETKKIEIRKILKEKLETPKDIYGIKRIPFKISGSFIRKEINSALELYNKLKKGLEYDV